MKFFLYCTSMILLPLMLAGCVLLVEPENPPIETVSLVTWNKGSATAFPLMGLFGVLDISSDCVTAITETQAVILLVWPAPTFWDASKQAIEFIGPHDNATLTLKDGDRIALGGMRGIDAYSVESPYPACEVDDIFILHEARIVDACSSPSGNSNALNSPLDCPGN